MTLDTPLVGGGGGKVVVIKDLMLDEKALLNLKLTGKCTKRLVRKKVKI